MVKWKTVQTNVKQAYKIICDRCKKEIKYDDWIEYQEAYCISFTGGYGSVFGDGNIVKMSICQHCLKDMIKDKYTIE